MKNNNYLIAIAIRSALALAIPSLVSAGDVEVQLPAAVDAFTVDQPAGTELMRVNGDGNVGIGTDTFNTFIFGSGTHLGQQITHKDGTAVQTLESYRNALNHSKVWAISSRGTKDSPLPLIHLDYILELNATAYDGTHFDDTARITLGIDGDGVITPGSSMPGLITFRTSGEGVKEDQERMRIDNAGNVSIGTTAPLSKLHVSGGDIRVNGGGLIIDEDGSDLTGIFESDGNLVLTANVSPLREDIVIANNLGLVGIGKVPTARLDVAGNIKVGDAGAVCDAATEGQIRYNATDKKHQGCDGTNWNNLY